MQNDILLGKYPVVFTSFSKDEIKYKNIDEIVEYFKDLIEKHPVGTLISVFDQYSHTNSLPNGEIAPEIKDCKIVIFCFGRKIPNVHTRALRPRSITITEFDDKFEVAFMEAPSEDTHKLLMKWVKDIKKS